MQLSTVSKYMSFSAVASGVLLYCLGSSAAEAAGPVAAPPYTLSVFATNRTRHREGGDGWRREASRAQVNFRQPMAARLTLDKALRRAS
jgi:hypothetical protein